MNIYIANVSDETTEEALRQAFEAFGRAAFVNIVKDRFRGQSSGLGFVDVLAKAEDGSALEGLNGKELKKREAIESLLSLRDKCIHRKRSLSKVEATMSTMQLSAVATVAGKKRG